jgi:polar amino acid transport system substrate-binding protein
MARVLKGIDFSLYDGVSVRASEPTASVAAEVTSLNRPKSARLLAAAALVLAPIGLCACHGRSGDTFSQVTARGELRWGADEEGGGPYVYRDRSDPNRLVGFEIDLMALLCERLKVRSTFVQGQWDDLPKGLGSGACDVIVNGFELTPSRISDYIATIPYYIYELQLFALRDSTRPAAWADLRRPEPNGEKTKIGVLRDTVADRYLTTKFANSVEVVRYSGTTEAFRDVENGNIAGTLVDTPAAVFYGQQFRVRPVGPPVERGYYVIYLRPGDERLRDALDDGIRAALVDGRLRSIYERYRLWNDAQSSLSDPAVQALPSEMRAQTGGEGGWTIVRRYLPALLRAAGTTLRLSLCSMPIAIAIGLVIALGRFYGPAALRIPLTIYVEFLRGTPLLLQLLFVYYVIPAVVPLPDWLRPSLPFIAAVAALAINYSAYEAEIYRAGLLAIPDGQMEAAVSLGLTRRQAVWHIVVPQAVRLVVPPVTNDFIALFKDTAICSMLPNMVELTKQYQITTNNYPRAFLELAFVTSLLYLLMSYPLALLTRRLERKAAKTRA